MPQEAWSYKRERQYEHIKDGLKERGTSTKKAKEIAARTRPLDDDQGAAPARRRREEAVDRAAA